MPKAIVTYVKAVEKISWVSGHFAMYLIFLMIGILAYASIMKVFFLPANWTVEMAQFVMVAYFTLGGAFSLREDDHVRMDLLYAGWNVKRRSKTDLVTGLVLIAFLVMLLVGGIASLVYAFEYGEKSYSAWAPVMWPIKVLINIGVFLTLLQAVAIWFKDLAVARGEPIQ
ncbi:TRAP transporter small permease subunit [Mesorhizobium sp. NBSH29]|uniref:TRAP transporter small permease subunit n=1 Tax=Mesorhizobium sp. NBSH29 TaxID=2654249 RepID=UPI0018965D63|nr:TRAP transporter small permease subunit [Mesorhizobium sp. NBSH29]QPC85499.1 TRAP transporter small permease subunit [Mesorhizobium sp. NBSH29]